MPPPCGTGAANYTNSYVEALILGTPKDQMTNPVARKQRKGFSSETIARMEQEMVILERDLKAIESGYGENMLNLTLARAPCPKAAEQSRRVRVFERPLREDSC